jgi:curved DNA-binding protein CbpA
MTDRERCLQTLDLPVDATPEQIKRAYRELAQIWHPDRYINNVRLRARADANDQ